MVALLTESVDWNLFAGLLTTHIKRSLSSRRAWIEIAPFAIFNRQDLLQSLSSRRAWIEMFCKFGLSIIIAVALLTESVDWNQVYCNCISCVERSLSSRRAWIEIPFMFLSVIFFAGRSPHGERGLKLIGHAFNFWKWWSLSSRRAWIEIGVYIWLLISGILSLSSRRAWIEISNNMQSTCEKKCRSPHGERGLKLTGCHYTGRLKAVALLTESVDWNWNII